MLCAGWYQFFLRNPPVYLAGIGNCTPPKQMENSSYIAVETPCPVCRHRAMPINSYRTASPCKASKTKPSKPQNHSRPRLDSPSVVSPIASLYPSPPSQPSLPPDPTSLWRRILLHNTPHLLLIRRSILLEQVERVGLRGRLWIRLVEQRLDAEQDLLERNGGLPALLFVEDREADGARGVDVRVEEGGCEFALWGLGWVL